MAQTFSKQLFDFYNRPPFFDFRNRVSAADDDVFEPLRSALARRVQPQAMTVNISIVIQQQEANPLCPKQ